MQFGTETPTRHRRAWRRRGLPIAGILAGSLIGLAALLAACGGTSAPSASPPTSNASSGGSSSSSNSSQSGEVAFAQCVRSHGVTDFPDPQNGHFLINGSDQNNPNFQSAVQACQHLLPGGSLSGGTGSGGGSNSSAELVFAHCMQTHGVPSFPDPSSNGALAVPQGIDANSPQFKSAFQACDSLLPNNGAGLSG
jgi:hypothetical protein